MESGLAQFESPFGNPSTAFDQGESTGMSVMDKAQQMQIAEQNQSYLQDQRQKLQPVIDAKNQADLATENAAINNMAQAQTMRTQIAQESPQAMDDFQAAMKLPDAQDRANALSDVAGKYSYFSVDPLHKNFMDQVREAQVLATTEHVADQHLKATMYDSDNNLAAKKYQADVMSQSRIGVANIREKGLLDATTIKAGAAMQDAVTRSNAPTDMMKTVGAMSQAAASGDTATADVYENYLQTKAGLAPTAIADDYIKMADSESKVATGLPQDSDEYAQHMRNSVNLMRRAQMILTPPTPAAEQPGNPQSAQPGEAAPGAQPSASVSPSTTQFPSVHESLVTGSRVPTPEEVGKLPAGTLFRGPDGKVWRAKGPMTKADENAPSAESGDGVKG